MITLEYITVMFLFCNHYIFSHTLVYASFFSVTSSERNQATNKTEIFSAVQENFVASTWNVLANVWR